MRDHSVISWLATIPNYHALMWTVPSCVTKAVHRSSQLFLHLWFSHWFCQASLKFCCNRERKCESQQVLASLNVN